MSENSELGDSKPLVVILHGVGATTENMAPLAKAALQCCPAAEIWVPQMPHHGPFGIFAFARVEDILNALMAEIDRRMCEGAHTQLMLVGHSFGAVLARKIIILAHGETADAPFEQAFSDWSEKRSWARKISRLVMLGGMSRGWSSESARSWLLSAQWRLGSLVGEILSMMYARTPTIFSIRSGSPFIIGTRLQWLALIRSGRIDKDLVCTQLLGTIDDFVAPADAVDMAVDPVASSAGRIHLVELPATDHRNCIELGATPYKEGADKEGAASLAKDIRDALARPSLGKDSQDAKDLRAKIFGAALKFDNSDLDTICIPRDMLADDIAPSQEPDVKDVVFVIHGIRDRGFWTQKIARAIKQQARASRTEFRSLTPSYGYFAMFPFVLPWVRSSKAAWFMERYTEAKARFPNAEFSYVGHSNGTYIAARALQDYPAVRFKRVVFAGSVVRRKYDWTALTGPSGSPRVQGVLNCVATADLVVAVFPKGMQPLSLFDLGSAGHDGFDDKIFPNRSGYHQVRYVTGGHGAGIKESQWDDIAKYIVNGNPPRHEDSDQSPLVITAGRFSTVILLVLATLIIGIGVNLLSSITGPAFLGYLSAPSGIDAAAVRSAVFALYCTVVFLVLQRV